MNLNTEINFCKNDLNDNLFDLYQKSSYLAVDTEAMGLVHGRDRLCVIQISNEDNIATYIKIEMNHTASNKVKLLFEDEKIKKIFHFARFDVAALKCNLKINTKNIFCTKIASKLARTYTNKHGLKDLVSEFLKIDIDKKEQSSNWSNKRLTNDQIQYAINDVKYLDEIYRVFNSELKKKSLVKEYKEILSFLETRVDLDLMGWDFDIYAH